MTSTAAPFDPVAYLNSMCARRARLQMRVSELTRQLTRRSLELADVEEEIEDVSKQIAAKEGRQAA